MDEVHKQQTYQLAKIGHWEFDVLKDEIHWSDQLKRLHEVALDYEPNLESALSFYPEGKHRTRVRKAVTHAIEDGKPFSIEAQIITADGNLRWVKAIGEPKIADGRCIRIFGSTRDITAQREAEQQSRETRQEFREIIEHSTTMFYRHDTDHKLTYVSPQSEEYLGCSPEQAKQEWTNFVTDHPKNKEGLKNTEKAIKTGKRQPPYELQLLRKDGKKIWVLVNESPVTEEGETVEIVGSITNITDLKEQQEELGKLSRVARQTKNMVIITDPDERIEWVNKAFTKITGYSKKEVIGKHPGKLLRGPETDPETAKRIARKIDACQPFSEVIRNYTKDGQQYWAKMDVTPITDKNGEVIQFFSIQEDITQRKQTQQELREKEAQLRNIANNIDGLVHRYRLYPDGSDEFIYVSNGIEDLHELSPRQVIESPGLVWSQIVDEHLDSVRKSVQLSAQQLTPWDQKWKIETPSGQQKWIHGRGIPQKLEDGSVQWDTILLDVTTQKELEQNVNRQVSLLNHILDSIPGLFYMVGEDLTFERTNKNVELLFNLSAQELQQTNALTLIAPRERSKAKMHIGQAFKEGYAELETILIGGDGKEHNYYMNGSLIDLDGKQYVIGNGINITDRVKAEKENSVLLQEIHHRVKNNLAIISGILTLELDELADDVHRLPLERSVNRIHSIAKVHELLYQSSSFSQVNVKEYISDLTNTISDTLRARDQVDINIDVGEIEMNINEIIPLGMLLNELLTNSLKYAFQDKRGGLINLTITKSNDDTYKVYYCDNGRGFNQSAFENSETLGLTIVNMLLKQLQAEYEVNTEGGFSITFTFSKKVTGAHSNM